MRFSIITDANGYNEGPLLLPGRYQVAVAASGFKKFARSGITLALAEQLSINISLEVGAADESLFPHPGQNTVLSSRRRVPSIRKGNKRLTRLFPEEYGDHQ